MRLNQNGGACPLFIALACLLMQQGTHAVADSPDGEERRPNIVFILFDDLRFDALGFLQEHISTRHIDHLATRGVRPECRRHLITVLAEPRHDFDWPNHPQPWRG